MKTLNDLKRSSLLVDGASLLPVFTDQPVNRTTPLYRQHALAISKPWTVALREGG